jgi:diguanylate cyclase (GGDEF)-like protein/PAS domain S-box-containing protein
VSIQQDLSGSARGEKFSTEQREAIVNLSNYQRIRNWAAGYSHGFIGLKDKSQDISGYGAKRSRPYQLCFNNIAIVGLMILVSLIALTSKWFFEGPGHVAVFWAANAIVLGIALAAQRPLHPTIMVKLLAASMIGDAAAALLSGDGLWSSLVFALSNGMEVAAGSWLAWSLPGPKPHLNRIFGFFKLIISTSLVAPAISALPTAGFLCFTHVENFRHAYITWFAADGLGNALFVPVVITLITQGRQAIVPSRKASFLALGLSLSGFILVFSQSAIPPLFLIAPLLFPIIVTAGLIGTAINLALVAIIAVVFTLTGHGPMWALAPGNADARIFLLQGFLLSASVSTIPVAFAFDATKTLIDKLHKQKLKLEQREAHYRNLAELSSDIILISNLNRQISYVSPAATRLLGFKPDDVIGGFFHDFIHLDDHPTVSNAMKRLGGDVREISVELRARHAEGHYIWLEARSRIGHRSSDGNLEFISVMRDISTRRAEEERRLADLLRLDTLANTDPLTGLANRRRFTEQLDQEWHRAAREVAPIALLSLDAGNFKAFNDRYGHPAGDDALRNIAIVMGNEALRAADLVARIGGEEFAAILPGTTLEGALKVAERIRQAVSSINICHADSRIGILSVSIGVASLTPKRDELVQILIAAADRALYEAKKERNRVVGSLCDEANLNQVATSL